MQVERCHGMTSSSPASWPRRISSSRSCGPPSRRTKTKTAMRILVATDGSTHANAAVEWLRHLPFPPDREVMVITVVEPPVARWPGMPNSRSDLPETRIAEARRLADATASRLLTGRTSTGRVVEGDAQNEIIAAARDWGADFIVVGARGLGAVKGFLLGSVSLDVVRNAPCPVLVCRGSPREVRTVTVALDGSKPARQRLAGSPACQLRRPCVFGSSVSTSRSTFCQAPCSSGWESPPPRPRRPATPSSRRT